jgi:hypothetical protein
MMRMAKEYNKESFGEPPADEDDELEEGDE